MGTPVRSVVIVGGGIAGTALGFSLASEGLGVTILERTTSYRDRVRGEMLHAWGVAEAQQLGVYSTLMDAGARLTPSWRRYNRWAQDPVDMAMNQAVSGVAGSMNIAHPVACQALLDAAAASGATVIRGIENVELAPGSPPKIRWLADGLVSEASPDLVIGADGRASVVRKQVGIKLQHQEGFSCIAGLMIDGVDDIPEDFDVTVSDEDLYLLMFRQTETRARVYLATGLSGRHRFAGRQGARNFLAACAALPYPWAEQLAAANPAGPCGTVIGDDTWTPTPFADGVVLVGDAAGYNDPIMGEGLSLALRDCSVVSDLVLDNARTTTGFSFYGRERMVRMERLRLLADIVAVLNAEDCTNRAQRQEKFAGLLSGGQSQLPRLLSGITGGPAVIPDDAMDLTLPDQLRANS